MDALPDPSTIVLRRGVRAPVANFERIVRTIAAESTHLHVRWAMPDPDAGPGAAFLRDNEMVSSVDLVLAFFEPHHVMEGGTGHVVETAIDRNVPVYSFTIDEEALIRVGDHDPDAIWQETVEAYFA
jgi:hypothetical protein